MFDGEGHGFRKSETIERAVEAAAKADYEVLRRGHWDEQPDDFRDEWRSDVRPLVTAALAEVEAPIKAQALREYADATRHPWTVFRRDDGSPVTINDLMRETADRIEAGVPRG